MRQLTIPLFWKFTISIIAIVCIFGSTNVILIWNNVYKALENESEKRGLYIGHSLAEESIDLLLYEDYITLQHLVENVTEIDSSVKYVFILNEQKKVLVHTFLSGFPYELIKANTIEDEQDENISLIVPKGSSNKILRDIAVPILDGKLGTIRVGILEEGIRSDVNNTIRTLLIMVVVFLAIGIAGAFVFSHIITIPIDEISKVVDKLDFDSFKFRLQPRIKEREKLFGRWKIFYHTKDELDLLMKKINGMISRLEDAYSDLEKAQSTLIQSEKLASVGTLSAGLAHEINNPIAGLQNCLRRISKNPSNMYQNQKYLIRIVQKKDQLEELE